MIKSVSHFDLRENYLSDIQQRSQLGAAGANAPARLRGAPPDDLLLAYAESPKRVFLDAYEASSSQLSSFKCQDSPINTKSLNGPTGVG